MIDFLLWYIIITVIGWGAWPLMFHLLPGLPDRGYTVSRTAGLLLSGFAFWMLNTLGLMQNTAANAMMAIGLVIIVGILSMKPVGGSIESMGKWIKMHRGLILTTELLFLIAFAQWALIRAYNPEILGTEKPMEIAFLNGILTSQTFPPSDPWLSGYAISYYYLGYVLIGMIAKIAGTLPEVAFNLGAALLFALTCLGSFGMVYNLLASGENGFARQRASAMALLGPLLVALMGNLQAFFEMLLSTRWMPDGFWAWLDIQDISAYSSSITWPPTRYYWWWRASRVIHDRTIAGESIGLQPIDEFPAFSFVLGDMHPHVLALPFVLLALVLAFSILRQKPALTRVQIPLYVVVFGSLFFLNAWDLPIYGFVLIASLVLHQIQYVPNPTLWDLVSAALTGVLIVVAGLLIYTPWLVSFDSQAGGILPNVFYPTRLHQFFVMFGPFLLIIGWYLLHSLRNTSAKPDWGFAAVASVGLLVLLILLMTGMGSIAINVDASAQFVLLENVGMDTSILAYDPALARSAVQQAAGQVAVYRLLHPFTALLLVGMLTVAGALLFPSQPHATHNTDREVQSFILILVITGALLTLGPEFVYLRDNFGHRLNTIFKFYYATWILWGIASAYAIPHLLTTLRGVRRAAFATVAVVIVTAAMLYTPFAVPSKTGNFNADGTPPTLNGIAYLERTNPDDLAAILWLRDNAPENAVLVEAVGGAYSYYGRISAHTGIPTIIGWANHERQWRGDRFAELAGGREAAVNEIYNTVSMVRAMELLEAYNVTYVIVGSLERAADYSSVAGIAKFEQYLTPVFQSGGTTIYRVDQPRIIEETP